MCLILWFAKTDFIFRFTCRAAAALAAAVVGIAALAAFPADAASAAPEMRSPDLFGGVALRIGKTPYDSQWSRVRNATAEGSEWSALLASGRAAATRAGQVEAINRAVNQRLVFRSDQSLYGRDDYWATPSEALLNGAGDCEDYAILKMAALRALGVPAQDMYLIILKDLVARADHAVLAVQVDGRLVVLDNRSDRVTPAEALDDYRPVITLSATGAWTYGYSIRPDGIGALASNRQGAGGVRAAAAAPAL
jgi:predicted transglutaminase-like cysteine proteinase